MMRLRIQGCWAFLLLSVGLMTGCSKYIDDDLSDCIEPEPENETCELNYELRLVTNITTEINTQLNTTTDVNVANALRSHLQNIFTDFAHDVDLSFYDTENQQLRLSHDQHVMDASERSYTLSLPMREYMHLAVANIQNNQVTALLDDERCPTSQLTLASQKKDTINSHATGLFTARQPMKVLENVSQTFHVRLYMANCAAALVIDPRGHTVKDIKAYTTGFATAFHINDSIYTFAEKSPIVRTSKLNTNGGDLCFCSVNFPSVDKKGMKTVINHDFDDGDMENTAWQYRVYVTLDDGSVTESILNVRETLSPGQLRIIKAHMGDDGDIQTNDMSVGVSVTLDWNDGGSHNIDL